jgi:hypothetical protein
LTDFDAPLKGLPSLTGLPPDGILAYAPSSVRLRMSRPRLVPANLAGSPIPYSVESQNPDAAISLNWTVRDQVSRLGGPGTGDGVQVPDVEHQIGSLSPGGQVAVGTAAIQQPGIYLVTVVVEDAVGSVLGSYQEYARVVKPRIAVRLSAGASYVAPGGTLNVRLENRGTETVGYGEAYALDRLVKGKWVSAGGSGPTFSSQETLVAGTTNGCSRVSIPSRAVPGRYRVRKAIRLLIKSASPRSVTAAFSVR